MTALATEVVPVAHDHDYDSDRDTYDPRQTDDVLVLSDVSLRPDFLGFDSVKAIALLIVCVFLLLPGMLSLWFIPIMLAVDAFLLISAFILALVTPSHVGTTQYLRRRRQEHKGIDPVQRDPFYRSQSADIRHRSQSQSMESDQT